MLLQERMREMKVPFVDAYKVLLDAKEQDDSFLYFREDTHWNNTGARLVLNEIYAAFGLSGQYGITDYVVQKATNRICIIFFSRRGSTSKASMYMMMAGNLSIQAECIVWMI